MTLETQTRKRKAAPNRQQLVCVLADDSGSMRGPKAAAATAGIREMLLRCQTTGPRGADYSFFRLALIQFGDNAHTLIDGRPVREIDPDALLLSGNSGGTNITEALEQAYSGLRKYMQQVIDPHPQRDRHPVPLVLLFSDGHNGYGKPTPVSQKIKALNIDGEPVLVVCAGVATVETDEPDEQLLREIASPECYLHIDNAQMLSAFLAEVGSSGASSPTEVAAAMHRVTLVRGIED